MPATAGSPPRLYSPAAGLNPAQSAVAERLPLLHELFCAVCKPSCAKELEQLCACLGLAAGALPPILAGGWGDWLASVPQGNALCGQRYGRLAAAGSTWQPAHARRCVFGGKPVFRCGPQTSWRMVQWEPVRA